MTKGPKLLATASLAGLALAVSFWTVGPFPGSASASQEVGQLSEIAEARITGAFSFPADKVAAPAVISAAAQSRKGELRMKAACADQKWPEIASGCLVARGGSPARTVRSVTIAHETGEATTVLLRMPASQLASR